MCVLTVCRNVVFLLALAVGDISLGIFSSLYCRRRVAGFATVVIDRSAVQLRDL